VWCNPKGEERIFAFGNIKSSDEFFKSFGIKKDGAVNDDVEKAL
jgi:hypothetical protein